MWTTFRSSWTVLTVGRTDSRVDNAARLAKMMEKTVMGTKTGYAVVGEDAGPVAIGIAGVAKKNGSLLPTFRG